MKRNTHAIVPEQHFRLTAGQDALTSYQVGIAPGDARRPACTSPAAAAAAAAVQHRGGQAPVLQDLRHLPLLPAALQPGQLRR